MTTIAVIPARYASTRFPGKPLARQTGKYLIQHVCERVTRCQNVQRVVVATDDERIEQAVKSFGGEVCLTRSDHATGTDRVAEVAKRERLADDDLVLNVQGDEPEVCPDSLTQLIHRMNKPGEPCRIGTLAAPFDEEGPREGAGSPRDPNCVKVVVDARGRALYFSRSLIPFPRDSGGKVDRPSRWLLHLGVYAFRVAALREMADQAGQESCPLEREESLEQLRWLSLGETIAVEVVAHRVVGIDTPEEYAAFVARQQSADTRCRTTR